uniref:Cytosolic fatty-acid binding proteins domain-containing protein n=2 Tax=Acrobeloides nanus TaxID=290746 RepID=A0A914DZL7_9BILA
MEKSIPGKFFGRFKLERDENFDEYLASKGVNWFLRKMIAFSSVTKVLQRSINQENRYNMYNLSSRNTKWENWALDETFENIGLDGTQHKITFSLPNADTLTEKHIRMENPNDPGETYYYTVENDYLVLKMQNDTLTCRRFFKRLPDSEQQ